MTDWKENLQRSGQKEREDSPKLAFGPVPSRRLGRSIGINNIPAKNCTYSCIYCQLGSTDGTVLERRQFYNPQRIFADTKNLVQRTLGKGEHIDYLTFVPDGEPTLNINLRREIELMRELNLPLAILTNASLLFHGDVRTALSDLDLVSLKVDAVSQRLWKRVNRPHRQLRLEQVLEGIGEFSDEYSGTMITETMFVDDLDYTEEIDRIAEFLAGLRIKKVYIAVPTRPPAEEWVKPAKEEVLNQAFHSFTDRLGPDRVELLIGYEGSTFSSTGNFEEDLLSITSVHPLRRDAVEKLAEKTGVAWERVAALLQEKKLVELRHEGQTYYMRKIASR